MNVTIAARKRLRIVSVPSALKERIKMLITKTMLAVVLFGGLLVQSGTGYKVVGRYPIGGTGGWDYINIDSSARRLYVSHSTQGEVVDADTGKIVGTIADTPGVHGAIAAVFDPKSLEVKNRFPIGVAKTPTGLAYDAKTNRLFIGCRNEPKMVVMDATNGKVITSFPIGVGVDYAGFDSDAHLIFFSCSDGTLSIYREKSADVYEDAGAVKTQPSARTMAFDPKTKKIFLPAAEYTETPPAQPGGRPTRTQKPGSFVIVVVGKS